MQVNLKPLLGGAALQPHKCDPVEDSHLHIGVTGEIKNSVLPTHHSSRPTGLVDGSYGGKLRPPTDHLPHHQNVDKPSKTNLHYSQSVMHQSSSDQRQHGGIVRYPPLKHHHSVFRRDDWRPRHDSHSPQVYDTMTQGNVRRQNYYDAVSNSFHSHFVFFVRDVNCNTVN